MTFLKMQFCTATSTAMAIFMLGLFKYLPQVSFVFFVFFCIAVTFNIMGALYFLDENLVEQKHIIG